MALATNCSLILAALLVLVTWAQSRVTARTLLDTAALVDKHELWMVQHGRTYKDDAEKVKRFEIFKKNVEYIESFNELGGKSHKLAVNKFADMTNEEFLTSRTGFKMGSTQMKSVSSFKYENFSDIPPSMDWRENGAVADVKYQGNCGCCWAFSAVAAVESLHQLKTGSLIPLSEQELVDCNSQNGGCGGGRMDLAFEFIINNGLTTESDYPFQAIDGTCNNMEFNNVVTITGYENVPTNSESDLLRAVAMQPVSVVIEGSGSDFRFYSSGVFSGQCGTYLDHAVVVVGFGETSEGKYWLVKNSWGTSWGENGYMKIQRDVDAAEGLCGIAMQASYPTA